MPFESLKKFLVQFQKLSIDEIAYKVASRQDFQNEVIRINTVLQLSQKGEDSTGTSLETIGGGYSPITIEIKRAKGQPIDHVTLKDTGDFYRSFRVVPYKGGFTIEADPIKDDTNLYVRWGDDIIGIQDEYKYIIIDKYVEEIVKKVEALRTSVQ